MGLFSWLFGPKKRKLSAEEISAGYHYDADGVIRDRYSIKVPQPGRDGVVSDGALYAYTSRVDEEKRKIEAEKIARRPFQYDKPVSGRFSSRNPNFSNPPRQAGETRRIGMPSAIGAPYERKSRSEDNDLGNGIADAAVVLGASLLSSTEAHSSPSHSSPAPSHSPSYDSGGYDSGSSSDSSSSSSDSGGGGGGGSD